MINGCAFLGFLIVLMLVAAPTASAYRTPTKTAKAQIVTAIHAYLLKTDCGSAHTCRPRISGVRVSLANQSYATASLNVPAGPANHRPSRTPSGPPRRTCHRCGGPLPNPRRVYCDDCLPFFQQDRYQAFAKARQVNIQNRRTGNDPCHGGTASQTKSQRERREWEANNGDHPADPAVFEREILPLLQNVPLPSLLVRRPGLRAATSGRSAAG